MAIFWQLRRPAGFNGGNAARRARSESPALFHSRKVSGRGKVKTSRDRGLGSAASVKRVMTLVLS
jgi:hypothetical protein